jgi:hypothetical protein
MDELNNVYYGTLSINPNILTVVKVIKSDCILKTRMIEISFWKSNLADKNYKYAVISIRHSTISYYNKEQLCESCDEQYFNELYAIAIQQF